MIDVFLAFLLVSVLPIAFIGVGGRLEHVLFLIWRALQLGALLLAFGYLGHRLWRARWADRLLLVVVAVALGYVALSYDAIAWDAQMEYHRVLLLADRWGSLSEGYAHGMVSWLLGYPPGASLSVIWYRTVRLPSVNMAQDVLLLLWAAVFVLRHMQRVDAPGKIIFFGLLATNAELQWHATFFYNNLFYALIWAQFVLVPLFGSTLRPWEQCAYALVLVWLRPQWQIAAIPIASGALAALLSAPSIHRRCVRDTALVALAAVVVAWLAGVHWYRIVGPLGLRQQQQKVATVAEAREHQDPHVLQIEVATQAVEKLAPPSSPLLSSASVAAIGWAFGVSWKLHWPGMLLLLAVGLLAVATLRRRGLVFVVPWLSPLALIVGTAAFAHVYPNYRANTWALERMQIVVPILAAGAVAALHARLRRSAD